LKPFARLLRIVRSRPRLRRQAWRLDGTERFSGQPLSILCTATRQTRNYLIELLFSGDGRETNLGYLWIWNLASPGWARKRGFVVVVLQIDPFVEKFLAEEAWFLIPVWVAGAVALPIPDTVLKDKSVRSDLQEIRKAGFSARVTRDPALLDDFYNKMYVPHVTRAHGSSVYVLPYDELRGRLTESDLLLIHDGVRDIAGMMILYERDRPRLWATGVRDGDRRHLKQGALAAVYYFSFQHLAEQKFASVNLGLSRTFLNSGVLRYKRKWGQKLFDTSNARIAVKVTTDTPASRSFLRSHPFIFERSGKLYGAVFLPDEAPVTANEAARLKKRYLHAGLSKLILFSACPGGTPHDVELPADVSVKPFPSPGDRLTLD